MPRSYIKVEITEELIGFNIFEGKCWGAPDEQRTEIVLCDANEQVLSPLNRPYNPGSSLFRFGLAIWMYWIPQRNQWVGFGFSESLETSGSCDEFLDGPHLVLNEPPPPEEEIVKATENGKLVERIIQE